MLDEAQCLPVLFHALGAVECGGHFRDWWEAYLSTYVERDLPAMGVRADFLVMRKL